MTLNSIRVALLLAWRYIRHTNKAMSVLVVFVMLLTFLNLVVVTGILVGLPTGAENAFREQYAGDVLISPLPEKRYIEQTSAVTDAIAHTPGIAAISPRYVAAGEIEANYRRNLRTTDTEPDVARGEVVGITIAQEARVTKLPDFIVAGEFLHENDWDMVVIGANLVERYQPADTGEATVANVYPGDKVLLRVGAVTREVTVKGIVQSKAQQVDQRVYLPAAQMRLLLNRYDHNVDEIAMLLSPNTEPHTVTRELRARGVSEVALVRTASEAIGSFLDDIKQTFAVLGNVIGAIGLAVASITIFIVIFIMAITRQKSIGILKGIGITNTAIELSYVILAFFYTTIGIALGLLLLFFVLIPYFAANPIDFPFAEGVLAVSVSDTAVRVGLLTMTTLIAGYVPATLVVRKPALDAIQGR